MKGKNNQQGQGYAMWQKADEDLEIIEGLHGGSGKAIVRQLFADKLRTPIFVYHVTLSRGATVGWHKHSGSEEIYYFLEGEGIMKVDDKEFKVHPGHAILTRSDSAHSLENLGEADLSAIVINGMLNAPQFLFSSLAMRVSRIFASRGRR